MEKKQTVHLMDPFAAGIIPYKIVNGKKYFLLGLERSNNKWSGFVGGSERGEIPIETAIREFHEETRNVFNNYLNNLQLELGSPFIDRTSTGKKVYLWFLEIPGLLDLSSFYSSKLTDRVYREKIELKYFSLKELVRSKDVLYQLKEIILRTF
jgi:8-oxo-dGTP pyrophosphatase MutT (NUDIX family)